MECLSGVRSIVSSLWPYFSDHATYILDLEENLASLMSERFKLKNISEDVTTKVREIEEQQMRVRNENQVHGWLKRDGDMKKEVDKIVEEGEQEVGNKCLGSCCPKNCWSSYKVGKNVLKMIPRVIKLIEEGQFDVVADELPCTPVDELPMDNVVVGFESRFEEVWQSVINNDCSVIGLVGMGGVGKTTLLKQLNNQFLNATHDYHLIIWIVVSKPANLGSIRSALRNRLNIPNSEWENTSEDKKNSLIFTKLKERKFVVLLDDMWEGLQLSEVGIARPSMNSLGSKVVLTTRSREVCRSMDADKVISVDCLPPDQAFNLFYSKLEEDMLESHPEMRALITDVVSECEGLPLALITIGRAMGDKTDPQHWKEAKRTLQRYPSTFPGMEGDVFSKLIFSYDNLPNPMFKKCFEYCSLYPEDHNIFEEEVIKLWIAEGFIGEYDSMYDALIQGRQIMESLKQACLLETGERSTRILREEETVKMHDMIRDMTLWIACERGKKMNKFCVKVASGDDDDITVAPNAMAKVEKIFLWGAGITSESLAGMSCCPNLATLILQHTKVRRLPDEIVHSRNVLKVLHLSGDEYTWFPENVSFTNLEYLNFVGLTKMSILPAEVSQWKKLRFLIVDSMIVIPRKVISSLCSLQMFEQFNVKNAIKRERGSIERVMLLELKGLKHIMDIRLTLNSITGIKILLDSPKLQRCTTRLTVKQVDSLPNMFGFGTETLAKHLERLEVFRCQKPQIKLGRPSLGNNLCEVLISCCQKVRSLSSLIYAPNLCILDVYLCNSMEELIGEETRSSNVGTSLFSSLTSINLENLPKLRSICPQDSLPFPSLKFIEVFKCSNLVKLPLDSNTARTTRPELKIRGEEWWWDRLEWDSQATKDAFTPKFIAMC